jgi:hypothetical protein
MRKVEIFPVIFSWEVAFSSFSGEEMQPRDITATAARIVIIIYLFKDITWCQGLFIWEPYKAVSRRRDLSSQNG